MQLIISWNIFFLYGIENIFTNKTASVIIAWRKSLQIIPASKPGMGNQIPQRRGHWFRRWPGMFHLETCQALRLFAFGARDIQGCDLLAAFASVKERDGRPFIYHLF